MEAPTAGWGLAESLELEDSVRANFVVIGT
jgi:hypothetical protein